LGFVDWLVHMRLRSTLTMGDEWHDLCRERADLVQELTNSTAATPGSDDATNATTRVLSALAAGDALVEFVQWHDGRALQTCAFVVRPDRPIVRIELGLAAEIDRSVASHLQLLARSLRPLDEPSRRLAEFAALRLRALVLVPLEPALSSCQRVWFAPEGSLTLLPFDSLPTSTAGTFLLEAIDVRHLRGGNELLSASPTSGEGLLVVDGGATDLPEASREARAIAMAWDRSGRSPALLRLATDATLLDDVRGHAFVHFAAQGRLLRAVRPEPEPSPFTLSATRPVLATSPSAPQHAAEAAIRVAETSTLDLTGCRLVVLSSADPNTGNTLPGDHLVELRHLLHKAGAAASLTVAWQTDDREARELMEEFWQGLLVHGDPGQALRQAKLAQLERNRRAHHDPLAGTWAAFQLVGR
jgi:CHAT domain-containing protein